MATDGLAVYALGRGGEPVLLMPGPHRFASTLVLCGRHDPQFPLPCSLELATAIPEARLAVFDRSSHYPFIEEPSTFWAAVARFLAPPADTDTNSSTPSS